MSIVVWSERQVGKWTDCVFSAYGMALEYAGFSAFPLGVNTAAEREAFAGPYANKASGTTLAQADAQAKARYGTTLKPLDTTLANALTRPGYALVVTGNYNKLSPNSNLVKNVYAWNNYDKSKPLPDVSHAVTIITNPDGTLTWLDPTAKQGSAGVPVTVADVLSFAGTNRTTYPVRMAKLGELASGNTTADPSTYTGDSIATILNVDPNTPVTKGMIFEALHKVITTAGLPLSIYGDIMNAMIDNGAEGKRAGDVKVPTVDALKGIANKNPLYSNPVTDTASAIAGLTETLTGFLGKLTNPANWLHAGAMLAGVGIVAFGMYMVTKDISQSGPQGMVSSMPIILKEGA